jgi:hypothetical protein
LGTCTVTVRVADAVAAPRSSVATAVRMYEPAVEVVHVNVYGLEVSEPSSAVPA